MNVLVLGAGFSMPAGLPDVDSFVREVLREWRSIVRTAGLKPQEAARHRDAVQELWNEMGKPDIEELLLRVDGSPEKRREVSSFVKIGVSGFARRYVRNELRPPNRAMLDADYDSFARFVELHRPVIVSFNYDLICEYLLRDVLKMRDDYGVAFDRTGEIRVKEEQSGTPSTWHRPPKGEKVTVLKPCGSVNWTWCPRCQFAWDHVRHVADRIDENPPACGRCGAELEPLIAVPGSTEIGGKAVRQLEGTWERVERALGAGVWVCLCGYSSRTEDQRFAAAVERSVGRSKRLRKLTVINPEGSARRRIKKLFERSLAAGVSRQTRRKKPRWGLRHRPRESAADLLYDAPGETVAERREPEEEPGSHELEYQEFDSFGDWARGEEVE